MKKIIILLLATLVIVCCSKDENKNNYPNIPNYRFSVRIDMNLPAYISLSSPGNGIKYSADNTPELMIFNSGTGILAFDAACPDVPQGSCASMQLKGTDAICSCDKKAYSLFNGQSEKGGYPMKPYRVEQNGSTLNIYN